MSVPVARHRATLDTVLYNSTRLDSLEHSGRVAQRPENVHRVSLVTRDNLSLDCIVQRGFLGAHESSAHVDTNRSESKRSSQARAVSHSTGRNEGNLELLMGTCHQYQAANVVLTRVTSALESINAEHVHAQLLRAERMTDSSALVNHICVVVLEKLDDRAG